LESNNNTLELTDSLVDIDAIEGRTCSLSAMIDTGSPVSFVKYHIYCTNIKPFKVKLEPTDRKFVNIKDLPLEIIGTVNVSLTLRQLKGVRIKDQTFAADVILGVFFKRKINVNL